MKRTEAAVATTAPEITIDAASEITPSTIIAMPMTPPTAGDIRNTPTFPKDLSPRSKWRSRAAPGPHGNEPGPLPGPHAREEAGRATSAMYE